jgi:hypothetical protein
MHKRTANRSPVGLLAFASIGAITFVGLVLTPTDPVRACDYCLMPISLGDPSCNCQAGSTRSCCPCLFDASHSVDVALHPDLT